ncbi:hypothetical protein GCM10023310_52030 [Paenibacillus vulneris]|uniref:Uncharacterized protein n=1 Tax=Paenibacillus vulneris TaxID=1133364 RepID=A0ABW3ULE9_9BACL|nr:hypothetical protein [Paenibacillus sp. 32352]
MVAGIIRRIGRLSLACVFAFTLFAGSALAQEGTSKQKVLGLEVLNTFEQVVKKDGVELTITRQELKGGAAELERLIQNAKATGEFIIPANRNSKVAGSSITYGGNGCENNSYIQACVYATGTISVNWAGFAGFRTNGTVIQNITGKSGYDITEQAGQPRVKAVAYGIVGGDTIIYNTYNYKASDWGTLTTFNFNESEPGLIVTVGLSMGADFKYKLNGNWVNTTVWAPLTQQ